jgi:hypothetical protein
VALTTEPEVITQKARRVAPYRLLEELVEFESENEKEVSRARFE